MKVYWKEKMLFMHVYAVSCKHKCMNGNVLFIEKSIFLTCLCRFMHAQMYDWGLV